MPFSPFRFIHVYLVTYTCLHGFMILESCIFGGSTYTVLWSRLKSRSDLQRSVRRDQENERSIFLLQKHRFQYSNYHGSFALEFPREIEPQRFLNAPPPHLTLQAFVRVLPPLHALFHGRLVDRIQHFFIHSDIVPHERPDTVPHPRDLLPCRRGNKLIHRRIDRLRRLLLQPRNADFLPIPLAVGEGSLLRDPHVPVHAKDHVHLATPVRSRQSEHVRLGSLDTLRIDFDKMAVPELPVFQRAGMERCSAVLEEGLDFGNEEVALGEECADLKLVGRGALAEDAAGKID